MIFEQEESNRQLLEEQDNHHLLKEAANAKIEATQIYYAWTKQMLSLSFAALTALVALQGNYQPSSDIAKYLLWVTFGSLAASVVATAVILRGEGWAKRALSNEFLESRKKPLEERGLVHKGDVPTIAKKAGALLPWLLILAVLSLFAFGIANSVGDATDCLPKTTLG